MKDLRTDSDIEIERFSEDFNYCPYCGAKQ